MNRYNYNIGGRFRIETRLSHALLDSSVDFIKSAVESIDQGEEDLFKFAVLHITIAFELLFKSCLAEEHWSLVFSNLEKASLKSLQGGNFQGIDFDNAQKRIQNISNIALSSEEKDLLTNLKKVRNRITHFHIKLNKFEIKVLAAKSINAYIDFFNANIAPNWEGYEVFGYELAQKLSEFEEFVKSRVESLQEKLQQSKKPMSSYFKECGHCYQNIFILENNDTQIKCLFCGKSWSLDQDIKSLSDDESVGICPICKCRSLIVTSIEDNNKNFECVICGHFIGKKNTSWVTVY